MAEVIGTNVIAPIVPADTLDTYPTHLAEYGKGGWRAVTTMDERDAIPLDRREVGMAVFVTEVDKEYTLVSLETMEWKERVFGTGPGGGGGSGGDLYKVEITSSNGIYVKKTTNANDVLTVLSARAFLGSFDITDSILSNRFSWTRTSVAGYETEDINWNFAHAGGFKNVNVTTADLHQRATFSCSIT